jgi:hypothetical protein
MVAAQIGGGSDVEQGSTGSERARYRFHDTRRCTTRVEDAGLTIRGESINQCNIGSLAELVYFNIVQLVRAPTSAPLQCFLDDKSTCYSPA